jgi:hypothetical protein
VAVTLETPRMACSASMTARIAAGACDGRRRGAWALAHDSRGLPRLRPREGGAWVSPVQVPVGRGQACYGVAEHWREQRRELGAAFARHRPCRRGADCRCLYPGVCVGHRRLVCGATSLLLQRQQRPPSCPETGPGTNRSAFRNGSALWRGSRRRLSCPAVRPPKAAAPFQFPVHRSLQGDPGIG